MPTTRTPAKAPTRRVPPSPPKGRTPKQRAEELLRTLPADCTIEEIQYRLYAVEKAARGFKSIDEGRGISHRAAKARLGKWLRK